MTVISVRRIKNPRTDRICCECRKVIPSGTAQIRVYGYAERGDTPYHLYIHENCVDSGEVKYHLGKLDRAKL
jgi:hypothetical protein